jgi:DNA polymerase
MNKDIMLIGEAPGKDEVIQNKPFVGLAGGKLKQFMDSLGLNRDDLFVTNVIKYRLYSINDKTGRMRNRPAKKQEIILSQPYLIEEIDTIKPRIILTLGNVPLYALTNDSDITIGKVHGKEMKFSDTRIKHTCMLIPMYHPASLIYNKSLESVFEEDLLTVKSFI